MQEVRPYLNQHLGRVFVNFIILLGIYKIFGWAKAFLAFVQRHWLRPSLQPPGWIYETYGYKKGTERTWAVVTGGSDGIGLEVCKKLAREGFNICIVSRSKLKIIEKLEEITQEQFRSGNESFKTRCVVADFSIMYTMDDYEKLIGDKIQDIDVGIVVLNAGKALTGPLVDMTDSEVEQLMQINANHVIYTAKTVIAQLIRRFEDKNIKSALMMTSSAASTVPMSGLTVYSAAKVFSNHLAQGLFTELKDQVDVITYTPGFVLTKMAKVAKQTVDFETITSEEAADVYFRDLGIEQKSSGSYKHELQQKLLEILPLSFIQAEIFKRGLSELEAMRKNGN